jgi:hypothetical protein
VRVLSWFGFLTAIVSQQEDPRSHLFIPAEAGLVPARMPGIQELKGNVSRPFSSLTSPYAQGFGATGKSAKLAKGMKRESGAPSPQ